MTKLTHRYYIFSNLYILTAKNCDLQHRLVRTGGLEPMGIHFAPMTRLA